MSIKASCGHCNGTFTAKDELAGKRVKCPACKKPMTIPALRQTPVQAAAPAYNPLLDLLDEAGVESAPRGPICENCGAEMGMHAVVCVDCGFNLETGEQFETEVHEEKGDYADEGLSDAEKIMAKAERDIEEMPVTAVGQDFGDGADSILIAGVALVVATILVALGVGVIAVMDWFGELIDPAVISFVASVGMYLICAIWITIVAFLMNPVQGIVCVATNGLYCIIFGFMQGRALIMPTLIMLASILIGLISWYFAFVYSGSDEFGMIWDAARNVAALAL